MRWPRFRTAGGTPPTQPRIRHSLALGGILDHLAGAGRKNVVDLGPAVGANVQLLSGMSCHVRILDVRDTFANGAGGARPGPSESQLPRFAEGSIDAVLAWDVLDYLDADQIGQLTDCLAPACGSRGLMLALLSTEKRIPPGPLRHRILDRETLVCEGPLEPRRPSPLWTQADLGRLLPGFEVRRSYVLRHGVREYLLAGGGEAPTAGRHIPGPAASGRPGRWWYRRG